MRKAVYLLLGLVVALGLVTSLAGCGVLRIGSRTPMATAGSGLIYVDNIPEGGVTGGTAHGFCAPAKPDEWHFVITNLDPKEAAPASMTAVFADEGSVSIPLEKVTPGGIAHYALEGHLNATLVEGYAYLGQEVTYTRFNLSHAPCEEPGPPVQYTIVASAGSGGSISPAGDVTVSHGGNLTFNITAATGYEIADVVVDGNSIGPVSSYTFEGVTSNHTIYATFGLIQYSITASAGDGGSISPAGDVSVSHGGNLTLIITPDRGYEIAAVVVDGNSIGPVSSYTFENVTFNHTIQASFSLMPRTMTYAGVCSLTIPNSEGGWVVSPGEGVFPYVPGSLVRLVAVPADGYKFVGWTGDVEAIADVSAATTAITMLDDYQINANFAPDNEGTGARIAGVIKEVNCHILPGANVTLYQDGEPIVSAVSDEAGTYQLPIPAAGDYQVVASKDGFRDEAQTISVTGPTTCVLDFVSDHGLIPNAPDVDYVLACVSLWKFGELPCQLGTSRILDLISAWVYPIT